MLNQRGLRRSADDAPSGFPVVRHARFSITIRSRRRPPSLTCADSGRRNGETMRGFAVIDNQPGSESLAVWITSHVAPQRAGNSNAVTIDRHNDPDALAKVRSLTRSHAVLLTDGSTVNSLPVEGDPLTVADIEALITETTEQQALILEA